MLAIALHQPWATLMAIGAKKYETRDWPTKHREQILVYAAKKDTGQLRRIFLSDPFFTVLSGAGYDQWAALPFGALLSIHKIVDVQPTQKIKHHLGDLELAFGNYRAGRWAFDMPLVREFDKPIPFKYPLSGPSKFFEVPPEVLIANG
jgi:activating signal cointegrator 1